MLRTRFFRGLGAIGTATAATCAYCLLISVETVWAGLFVVPLVAPSVALFILLEKRGPLGLFAYLGFILPVVIILAACWCEAQSIRYQLIQDGSAEVLTYVSEILTVGALAAFAFLAISSGSGKGAGVFISTGIGKPK
ncbi:MAG: hypothetical protein ACYC35_18345 [Pirellulales bacterium]